MAQCQQPNHPEVSFGLVGVASLILEAVGLFGNAISILILINRFLKKDVFQFFLSVLCVVDMGTLLCAMFMLTVPEFVYSHAQSGDLLPIVNTMVLVAFPIGHILKTISSWLVAVMSLFRFVYVKNYLMFNRIGRKDCARAVVACVCIASFMLNIPRFFELKMDSCVLPSGEIISFLGPTLLRNTTEYQLGYHVVASTVFRFAAPLSMILFCNSYLLAIVYQTKSVSSIDERAIQYRKDAASILLASVGFIFVVCNSFALVANLMEVLMRRGLFTRRDIYTVVTDLNNFFTVANSSFNFLLYLAFSNRFRSVVAEKFKNIKSSLVDSRGSFSIVHRETERNVKFA